MLSSEPLSGHAITVVNVPEECATSKGRTNLFRLFVDRRCIRLQDGIGTGGIVEVELGAIGQTAIVQDFLIPVHVPCGV